MSSLRYFGFVARPRKRILPVFRSVMARRTDAILAVGSLAMVLFAGAALAATGVPDGFLSWAWECHQSALSCYIRPLFILPLAYSTYKRSLFGILLMLAALSTRMFRFPAPGRTDPRVEGLLAFERGWLTGGWAMEKVVSTLAVAPVLGVLCLASWRRLSLWGLLVIGAIAVGKMAWGVVDGAGTGWAMLGPALAVLAVCDAVVLCFTRRARRGRPPRRSSWVDPA